MRSSIPQAANLLDATLVPVAEIRSRSKISVPALHIQPVPHSPLRSGENGTQSGLWLCEYLIWRTPRLPVLPSSQCPTKIRKGRNCRAAGGSGAVFSAVYTGTVSPCSFQHICAAGGCPHGLSSPGLTHLTGCYPLGRTGEGIK